MSDPRPPAPTPRRSQVLSWALWDFGATGVNAIVVTFVFSVYLTSSVGHDLPGETSPASWLGRALALAGLVVALLAPITGVWVDAPWRRRRVLAVLTGAVVLLTAAMSLIRDDYHYLWIGLVLLPAPLPAMTWRPCRTSRCCDRSRP
jgi:UMF1 family MFS transporter